MRETLPDSQEASTDIEYARHLEAKLEAAWVGLPDKPEETPASTMRALWLSAAGDPCSVVVAQARELPPLGATGRTMLRALVEKKLTGVPLAHLTGRQSFMGLELMAGPGALIPRSETELLGHAALELLRRAGGAGSRPLVIDVCTGSGNLALALAYHDPRCEVVGGDLSPEAVELARKNAECVGLSDRVRFVVADLFAFGDESASLRGAADLIVCNPPYISTRTVSQLPGEIGDHEPRLAFDGGDFGISVLLKLMREAPDYLKPAAWLCFEVGVGQGESMARRLERSDAYAEVQRVRDNAGEVRTLLARRRAQS